MLQNTNKRIQEYETSLLQYLQADATKNSETIAKLQKEKNTIVETMNTLKDHLQMQLDLEKVKNLSHILSVYPFRPFFSIACIDNCSDLFIMLCLSSRCNLKLQNKLMIY